MSDATLPLESLHQEVGARFTSFAGYAMPVQFDGVIAEHTWTRTHAGLFDVSHMGQVRVPWNAAEALERLVPVDVLGLAEGRQRYGLFTNDTGGVLDDLMIARWPDGLVLVVNAACKTADLAHLQAHLDGVEEITDRALLAIQGPEAEAAFVTISPEVAEMRFMDVRRITWQGAELWISRSGYTGEDGFEISVPVDAADALGRTLLSDDRVKPIGLGARDSLRREAGRPLYGQEMDGGISPVEAGQAWAIGKVRRTGGARAGGFAGSDVILDQLASGAPRRRVGLLPEGRAPMRNGVPLFVSEDAVDPIGHVTSGGFGPSLERPVALGLITSDTPKDATLFGEVRGKRLPVGQAALPFTPPGYKR